MEKYDIGGCPFCKEHKLELHEKVGYTQKETIIYEDENIYVIPDLSPICNGHYLIVPHKHYHSYSSCPEEVLQSLKKAMSYIMTDIYKSDEVTVFEHGAVFEGTGGSSIDHAHIHILLNEIDLISQIDKEHLYIKKIPFTKEKFITMKGKQPYLLVGNKKYGTYLFTVDDTLPSQYLRKVSAECLGSTLDYNWRQCFDQNESLEKLKETLNMAKF